MAWLCRMCFDQHLERSKDDGDDLAYLYSDDDNDDGDGTHYYGWNEIGFWDNNGDDDGDGDDSDGPKTGASSTLSEISEHGHVKCTDEVKETVVDDNPDDNSYFSHDDYDDGNIESMHYVSSWENDFMSTALDFAAQLGHEKCVQALLRAGADVNEEYPILSAVCAGRDQCLDLLIKAGAEVKPMLLTEASRRGHEKCVKLLLKAGVNINTVESLDDAHEKTALMYAAEKSKENCMVSLLEMGADVNFKNSSGETAVYCAALAGAEDSLLQLIKSGADVNITTNMQETPLYAALRVYSSSCVEHLLNEGAGVEAVKQYYILELVASLNSVSAMKRILREGAPVNVGLEQNSLETYIVNNIYLKDCGKDDNKTHAHKRMCMMLLAAGEKIKGPKIEIYYDEFPWAANVPPYLLESESSLKNKCREAIRNHLLELDSHTNLFLRIPTMKLPPSLVRYLLYGFSPEDNDEDDNLYEDNEELFEDDFDYNDDDYYF